MATGHFDSYHWAHAASGATEPAAAQELLPMLKKILMLIVTLPDQDPLWQFF